MNLFMYIDVQLSGQLNTAIYITLSIYLSASCIRKGPFKAIDETSRIERRTCVIMAEVGYYTMRGYKLMLSFIK